MLNLVNKLKKYIVKEIPKKQMVLLNSRNLLPGEYKFDKNRRFVYLKNNNLKGKAKWLLGNDPLLKNAKKYLVLLNILSNMNFRVLKDEYDFAGTIYFFTSDHKRDKIFDLENLKVKTLFLNNYEKEEYIRIYKKFSLYFKQPKIIEYDSKTITEELIDFDDKWEMESSVLTKIINDYINYYKSIENTYIKLEKNRYILRNLKSDEEINFFTTNISNKIINDDIITVDTHGDLRKNNILYQSDKKNIYYIDWELSNKYSLLYDLFFLMYHEALYNNNDFLIKQYMDGEFDSMLVDIYNIFDIEFDITLKKSYLCISMLEHYAKKVNYNKIYIERYQQLLKKI